MGLSRRHFFAGLGITTAAGVAANAWMLETRALAQGPLAQEGAPATKSAAKANAVARILFNENPLGPSPAALKAIAASGHVFNRYGMTDSLKLEMKIRAKVGLPTIEVSDTPALGPAQRPNSDTDLIMGIGSSEILRAAGWMCADQGGGKGNSVEANPSYDALADDAEKKPGAKLTRKIVPLDKENQVDVQAMADAVDAQTKVVVLCNPNNPTGAFIPKSGIEQIVAKAPESCLVFIDEAYIEYLPDYEKQSALELAKTAPNVLVARTFSKVYGLAGLRMGYAIANRNVIASLRPYMLGGIALNMAGLAAASAALDDTSHVQATRDLNAKVQAIWKKDLPGLGFKVTPSVAGFIWADVGEDCTGLVRSLQQKGVLISHGRRWNLPQYVRISIGTENEVDRLMEGIKAYRA
jgi:histidinol-phosphate aminotransferase